MSKARIAIAFCCFSAAGLVGLLNKEAFTHKATVPTVNDRPTVGFGSTFREDGSPVQMGDTITPQKAVARTAAHIAKDELGLKRCVSGDLHQVEYDVLVDFAYQYGVKKTCDSEMVREINAGNYEAACRAYTLYKKSGGFDCSAPGNKRCWGVWQRNLERQDRCLAAQ